MLRKLALALLISLLMVPSLQSPVFSETESRDNVKVAILVVDEFDQSPGYADLEGLTSQGGLCYLKPIGSGGQDVADADGMGGGMSSHGVQIMELLDELAMIFPNSDIGIFDVPVVDYQVEMIIQELENTISDIQADYYIVNMSFAIIPCSAYGNLAQWIETMETVQDAQVWEAARQAFIREYITEIPTLANSTDGSPNWPIQDNVFFVASAGNFGLDFPTWPAAWPFVISVSGGELEPGSDYAVIRETSTGFRAIHEFYALNGRLGSVDI